MDGHIKVELDFIPVEERLPGSAAEVVARVANGPENYIHLTRYAADVSQWFFDDGTSDLVEGFRITHWAEIPEIEEKL